MFTNTSRFTNALARTLAVAVLTTAIGVATTAAGAGGATRTITISSATNPSTYGQRVAFRARVGDASVPATSITGSATFSDGTDVVATVPVANAVAVYATKTLAAGDHLLSVTFVPADGSATVVSGPLVQHVVAADTTVTLTTSNPSVRYGDAGRITAIVRPVAPATGIATGGVDFAVDGAYFETVWVDATGRAILPFADLYASLNPGTHSITASYGGDANNNPSTGPAVTQTLVGSTTTPTTRITLDAKGRPVFSPRSFTLTLVSPVGCNVSVVNDTPTDLVLVYGFPGAWKRLPFGVLPAGASRSLGVSIDNYTGYFATLANTANYVAIHCR